MNSQRGRIAQLRGITRLNLQSVPVATCRYIMSVYFKSNNPYASGAASTPVGRVHWIRSPNLRSFSSYPLPPLFFPLYDPQV
jgi:hypothetical protein